MPTHTAPATSHTAVTTGWTNPSNAFAVAGDNVYATAQPAAGATVSGDFGFSDVPGYYADDFNRTGTGIGTSSDGHTYTAEPPYTAGETNGEAFVVTGLGQYGLYEVDDFLVGRQFECQYDFKTPPDLSADVGFFIEVWASFPDTEWGVGGVECDVVHIPGGSQMRILIYGANGFTGAASYLFVPDVATWYTAKFKVDANTTTGWVKVWKRGDTEPDWQASGTATASDAGGYPSYLLVGSNHASVGTEMDNVSLTSGIPDGATIDEVRIVIEAGMDVSGPTLGLQGALEGVGSETFRDDFDRTVGSGWDNNWTINFKESTTEVDVAAGAGRIRRASGTSQTSEASMLQPSVLHDAADILVRFKFDGEFGTLAIYGIDPAGNGDVGDGWRIRVTGGDPNEVVTELRLTTFVANVPATNEFVWVLPDDGLIPNTWYFLRARRLDGVFSGKVWLDGSAEPSWQLSILDAHDSAETTMELYANPLDTTGAAPALYVDYIAVREASYLLGSEVTKTTTAEGTVTYTFPANSVTLADLRSASSLIKARIRATGP